MRKLVKRVLVLADRDQGSSAMVVFTDTEGEIRHQLDAMFNQMSPGEGGGQRQSVDIWLRSTSSRAEPAGLCTSHGWQRLPLPGEALVHMTPTSLLLRLTL